MAPYLVSLLLFANLATPVLAVGAQTNETRISPDSSIDAGGVQSWPSPSGRFAFGFYPNGEGFSIGVWIVLGSASRTVVWTANRNDPPVLGGSIQLTVGGKLTWRPAYGGGQSKSISDADTPAASAAMLDTGNFVLYDTKDKVVWSTFSSPTDTLLPGQSLPPSSQMFSSVSDDNHATGKFLLANQEDGNLVLYPTSTSDPASSYWSTGTFGMNLLLTLRLETNGTFWLQDQRSPYTMTLFSANRSSSASADADIYYRATLDADGILRLYFHAFSRQGQGRPPTTRVEWEVPGNDRCLPKGACGSNSFCWLNVRGEANCSCLPGFELSSANQGTPGCWRASPSGRCEPENSNDDEAATTITMTDVKNTSWVGNAYFTLPQTTSIQQCKASCLSDCSCEIAMFSDSVCTKQMLPLRYGRLLPSGSNTTVFVKLYGSQSPQTISVVKKTASASAVALFISGACMAGFSLIVLSASALLFCKYRRSVRYSRAPLWQDPRHDEESAGILSYSFQELEAATDGFAQELGRGAFGTVFQGVLPMPNNNKDIAVKRLEKIIEEGEREFKREVRAIARTHHRNLVRLLGFCNEGPHRLLVYEYMPNGSLGNLLFKSDALPSWSERVAVALDVARGLQYLHEDIESPIIHCDIKPENILIDGAGVAKIADFGLAKLLIGDQTRTFTGVRGTRGYLAPEWSKNTAITVKADVYSFGVMLLEIISCKKSMELKLAGEEHTLCNISEWVYECVMFGEVKKVAGGECVNEVELERMAKVGIWCTQNEPVMRPAMKSVVLMMEGSTEVRRPPPPASFSQSLMRERYKQ